MTVFCMVLGSSSAGSLVGPGKKLRWVALFVVALIAVALALRGPRPMVRRSLRLVSWLGIWLAALAVCSTGWSVDPRLTTGRALSFGVLVVTGVALAVASQTREGLPWRLLVGVLAGTCAAAVAGVVMLVVAHGDAVQPVSTLYPARFRGLGENPDTVSMLEGLVAPVALWGLLSARRRLHAGAYLAAALLLLGSIVASGSRGGLLAAAAGGIVVAVTLRAAWRRRLVVAVAVGLTMAGATAATQIPKPLAAEVQQQPQGGSSSGSGAALPSPSGGSIESQYAGRLTDELYRNSSQMRSLWSSSGRLQAWRGALGQADARPLLGYGFGTENHVFIDRVYGFDGSYAENSFIGMYLQMGAVGVVSLVALLVAVGVAVVQLVRRSGADTPAPVFAAVMASGLLLMLVQSYAYSVGNVATVSFWTVCFVAAGVESAPLGRRIAAAERAGEGSVAVA